MPSHGRQCKTSPARRTPETGPSVAPLHQRTRPGAPRAPGVSTVDAACAPLCTPAPTRVSRRVAPIWPRRCRIFAHAHAHGAAERVWLSTVHRCGPIARVSLHPDPTPASPASLGDRTCPAAVAQGRSVPVAARHAVHQRHRLRGRAGSTRRMGSARTADALPGKPADNPAAGHEKCRPRSKGRHHLQRARCAQRPGELKVMRGSAP